MNLLQRAAVVLAMAAAVWLTGTAAGTTADGEKTVTITDKEKDTKVKLAKGDTLELKLEALPSAGYSWLVVKVNEDLLKQQGKATFEKPEKKVIGAKQKQVFRFKAEKAGAGDLVLEYKRPFEKDKPAAKTFKVNVTVE
jgi:inhibitor of cysteine peptidase